MTTIGSKSQRATDYRVDGTQILIRRDVWTGVNGEVMLRVEYSQERYTVTVTMEPGGAWTIQHARVENGLDVAETGSWLRPRSPQNAQPEWVNEAQRGAFAAMILKNHGEEIAALRARTKRYWHEADPN